jgi:hypothetical protein
MAVLDEAEPGQHAEASQHRIDIYPCVDSDTDPGSGVG